MYIFLYKIFVKNISRSIHIINTKIYDSWYSNSESNDWFKDALVESSRINKLGYGYTPLVADIA